MPPFFPADFTGSLLVHAALSGLTIFFLVFSAYSGQSKYAIIGAIRVVIQLLSYELILTCFLLIMAYRGASFDLSGLFISDHTAMYGSASSSGIPAAFAGILAMSGLSLFGSGTVVTACGAVCGGGAVSSVGVLAVGFISVLTAYRQRITK